MIAPALREGSVAVDATMGNGGDTLALCELVGKTGRVYAFDVQESALQATSERLEKAGLRDRATLIHAGHETMCAHVPGKADAVVFNLGWLPGAAHGVTTHTETTLAAVNQALELLNTDGVMTICIYPGHEEGTRERDALIAWAQQVDPRRFDVLLKAYMNQPNFPPLMLAVHKLMTKQEKTI